MQSEPSEFARLNVGHRRSFEIDVLRGVAVLMVLGRHWMPVFYSRGTLPAPLMIWYRGGWAGVDLFFVLSGFLVSGLLFREQVAGRPIRPGRFLLRRGIRIYPPFYIFLAISLFGLWFFRPTLVTPKAVVVEAAFVQNYFDGCWNHTWSLAVEEHFYLVVPFVLMLLGIGGKQRLSMIAIVTLMACALCTGGRIWIYSHGLARTWAPPSETHLRIDSLAIGVFLAAAFHFRHENFTAIVRRFSVALLIVGVGLMSLPFAFEVRENTWLATWGLSLLYVGSTCWISLAACWTVPRSRLLNAIAFIGSYSYSIYLWHMPVSLTFFACGFLEWFGFPIYLITAILVGIGAGYAIETPAIRLRERYFPANINPTRAAN